MTDRRRHLDQAHHRPAVAGHPDCDATGRSGCGADSDRGRQPIDCQDMVCMKSRALAACRYRHAGRMKRPPSLTTIRSCGRRFSSAMMYRP
jgi:hypothetical protein